MATRMLIDARHPEETRVAVLKGTRIEEFDFESADRKQIKGNIYLAKVTRVEPSLQAAFVDFGENRHGFLAFSEIHPDYYQIPKEDREALLAEEAAHAEEEAALRADEDDDEDDERDTEGEDGLDGDGGLTEVDTSEKDEVSTIEAGHVEGEYSEEAEDNEDSDEDEGDDAREDDNRRGPRGNRRQGRGRSKQAEAVRARRMALRRRYKIQDVIHRRQVLLVQVVKEERGNKGAALTTYLSLAGRYCVLMPNSSHGGGISRKISSASDRKRLKSIVAELNLPKSMGCIVRTAGLSRTKTEIKRDFDYLARLWDELREETLRSSAPTLIHSDSDLIKRAIRDIYNRDIEEVVIEGEEGYKAGKAFMKLLMPSHARRVKPYNDPVPLFQRYGAEDQLTAMYDPVVQLKSGGYIVINPTEALVSIDINSGRSTKEHGIEATAVSTNVEAAREIARQLRLRDMAGLVVIDFIDMEYGSNIRKVEKAMKDALKADRARIQVGRISSFGLMEMSRQRLRTGVLEATTRDCPHCDGTGLVRTASSAGLSALRLIEDEAAKGKGNVISLYASTEAAIYLLNSKRSDLADIEARYGVQVEVIPEGENEGAKMRAVSTGPRNENMPQFEPIVDDDDDDEELDENELADDEFESDESSEDRGRRKRRKRRSGRGRDRRDEAQSDDAPQTEEAVASDGDEETAEETDAPRKRRRRGGRRRRGRGRGDETFATEGDGETQTANEESDWQGGDETPAEAAEDSGTASDDAVADIGAPEVADAPSSVDQDTDADPAPDQADPVEEAPPAKPRRRRKAPDAEVAPAEGDKVASPAPARSRRRKAAEADPVEIDGTEKAPAAPKRQRRKPSVERQVVVAEKAAASDGEPQVAPSAIGPEVEPELMPEPTRPAIPSESREDAEADAPATIEASAGQDQGDSSGSPRRGWWQRTFGP